MAEDRRADAAPRLVAAGAALVATSVLADSALEHYRGSFRNPAMLLPLVASSLSIGFSTPRVVGRGAAGSPLGRGVTHAGAVAIGLAGLGFHVFNIGKRPGGASLTNLFYGAPIGAPAALILVGALAAAADGLEGPEQRVGPVRLGSGRAVGALAAAGIAGTVAEAALLHFRGAYHNPFMWAPVILPPVAAAALARDSASGHAQALTGGLLAATALLGLAGVGFHAYGIQRNMGGWRNWRQNILAGPPLPAPPAFTGLAIAGLGALLLMRAHRD